MPPLKNEFSWSISRARLFASCQRRYYYCYYGSWMGWDVDGPPEARLLYRLKQLMTLPMWAGKVVHRTIELAIHRIQQGHPMTLETMQAAARKQLNEQWRESEDKLYLRHPKKYVNLFEHYYQREISADRRAALRERVFGALAGWFELGCAEELAAVHPEDWLAVENLDSFDVNGVKVWVVMDCAFRKEGKEGPVRIYDWKTGAASESEGAPDQLICYALFTMRRWNMPLENIRVSLVHLPDRQMETHEVTAGEIIEFRERLEQSASAMLQCLADPARNAAREDDFPRTQAQRQCEECEYREVCWKD